MIYKLALLTLLTCCYATPPPGYVKPPEVDEYPPKYEYGYNIEDNKGSGQGKSESRDGVFSLGRYYVQLGQGQKGASQNVQYVTDEWGYHPVVEYSSIGDHSQASASFALGEKAVEALRKNNNNPSDVKEQIKQTAETVTPSPIPSAASLIGQGPGNSVQEGTIAPTAGQETVEKILPSPSPVPTQASPSVVQHPQQPTLPPFQVFLQPVHLPQAQFLIQPQALVQQSKFLIPASNHPQMQYAIPFYPTGITRFNTGFNYQQQHVPQTVVGTTTTQQAKIEQQQRDEQNINGQLIEQNVNVQQINVNQQLGEQIIKQDINQQLTVQNLNQQLSEQNINQQLSEQNIKQQIEQNINQQLTEQNIEQHLNQQLREQNINQQLEQNINQQLEQNINQQLEQNLNQQLREQNTNQQIEQYINQQLREQNINQQLQEQTLNQQLKEQNINQQLREQNIVQNKEISQEQGIEQLIENVQLDLQKENAVEKQNGGEVTNKFTVQINSEQYGDQHVRTGVFNKNDLEQLSQLKTTAALTQQQNEHHQSVINSDVVQQQNSAQQQANNNAYISSEIGEKNLEGILNLEINKYNANENDRDEKNAVNFIIHNGDQQNTNLNAQVSVNQNEQKSVYATQQGLEQNQQNAGLATSTHNQNIGYVTGGTDERHIEQTLKAAYISAQDSVANNQLQHVEYTNGGNSNYKESNSNEQIQYNQNGYNTAQEQQYYQKELKINNAANIQYNSGAEAHNNGQYLVEVTPTTDSISFKNQNIDQSRQEQYTNQQIIETATATDYGSKETDVKQIQYVQQSLQDDNLKNHINVNVDQNLNIQNTEALFGNAASQVKYTSSNSNSLNQQVSYDESILNLENPGGYGSKINARRPNVVNQHYEHRDQIGNRVTSGNNNHAENNKYIDQSTNQVTTANSNYEATNDQANYQVNNNNYIASNNNYQGGNNGNYETSNIKYETVNNYEATNTNYGTTNNNYEINTKLIDRTKNLVTGVDVLNINDAVGHNEAVIHNQLAKENHMINQYKAGNIQYGYNVNIPNTILQVVSDLNEFNNENLKQTSQQQSQQENLQAIAELQQLNGNKLITSNTNLQQTNQQVGANEYANSESGTVQSSIQLSPNFQDQNFAITQLYQQSNVLNSAANGHIQNARNNLLQILNAERILPAREENRISFADKPIVVAELENFPQNSVQSTTEFYRQQEKAIDESTYSTTQNTVETKITANSYESTESPIVITPRPVGNNFLAPITAAVSLQTSEQQQPFIQAPRPSDTYVQIQKSVPYYLGKVEYIENQQNGFVQHSKEQALFNTKLFLQNQAQGQQPVQVASSVEEINNTPKAEALIQSTKNHNNLFVQDQKQETGNIQQLSTGYDLKQELSNASQELTSAEIDGSVEESKIVNKPSQVPEYEENISVTLSRNPPRTPYLIRKENSNEEVKSEEKTIVEKPVAVHVAHPYPVEVEKIVEKQVQVPVPVPYLIEKRVPVERIVDRPVEITRIVEKPVAVHVPQPYPVEVHKVVEKPVPVAVQVTRYVDKPYPVHIPYPQPIAVPVQVERLVQKFVDKPYPVKVPVRVEVPVKVPVIQRVPVTKYVDRPVTVEKIVEKPVTVEKIVEKPVTKYIDKPYPVPVHVAVPHPIAVPVEIKVPQPYPVEVTKYIQRPYGVPQPYPVHVTKPVPYIQQVQYPVTKLVQVPVEVPKYVDRVVDRPYPVYVHLQEQYKNQQNPYIYAPKYQVDWKNCIHNQHSHVARAVKSHEYVGLVPPLKSATVFSNGSTQPQQHQQQQQQKNFKRKARNSFEQSLRLEYGFKPPMIPSVQTDEFGMPLTKEE